MAANVAPVAPLTNSQKLFLQRLLVAHVLTDERARQLYQSIKEDFANVVPDDDEEEEGGPGADQGYMGNDLEHCLGIINASLVPAFNLEVGTVSLPPPYDEDEEEGRRSSRSPGGRKRPHLVRYHAIVNRSNDDVARRHAFPLSRGGPHEMAYFRLALERIVERGLDQIEEGDNGVGCPGALNRMELINLRTEMEGNHKDKLAIHRTEEALEVLVGEGWLARVAPPAEDDGDDDEEGDEDEDEEDEEGSGGRSRRKRKKKRPSSRGSAGGSRRKSLKGTFYGIGPRSFLELGEFLQKAGLPGNRMPQSILHRI